jgi:hypothetical protein
MRLILGGVLSALRTCGAFDESQGGRVSCPSEVCGVRRKDKELMKQLKHSIQRLKTDQSFIIEATRKLFKGSDNHQSRVRLGITVLYCTVGRQCRATGKTP